MIILEIEKFSIFISNIISQVKMFSKKLNYIVNCFVYKNWLTILLSVLDVHRKHTLKENEYQMSLIDACHDKIRKENK
jgi:hypothetical protein